MILEKHHKSWFFEFERLKHVYMQTFGTYILGIEHVGSTAVPDLMAKPILDIDIIIQDYSAFPAINHDLESLGYYHNGNQGILHREVFNRKDDEVPYFSSEKNWMLHHLYVCPEFSTELKRHIRFRDVLRSDRKIRDQYEKLKIDIAVKSGNDRRVYANIKEIECKSFIYAIADRNG